MALDATFTYVIPKIGDLLISNADSASMLSQTVARIRKELSYFEDEASEAGCRRANDMTCVESKWLREVRSVMFTIEDALDSHTILCDKANTEGLSCTDFFFEPLKKLIGQVVLTRKLEDLEKKIQTIRSERASTSNNENAVMWNPTHSSDGSVAWDDMIDELIDLIDRSGVRKDFSCVEDARRVISIFGEVGVGKTTFVRQTYYAEWVRKDFQLEPRIWLDVVKGARMEEIPFEIAAQLGSNRIGGMSMEEVRSYILEQLEGRKYVVVLDGIGSRLQWDYVEGFLPRGSGCVVLIARCNHDEFGGVESFERSNYLSIEDQYTFIDMGCWLVDDCYNLLVKKVFRSREIPTIFSQLSKQEILDASGGNPLSVVILSGILKCNISISHWKKVFDRIKYYNDSIIPLKRVLTVAFDDLPFNLKPCFLYLSCLPSSNVLSSEKLCRMWIAEGFVREQDGLLLEEVADLYLRELIFRQLIRVVSKYGGDSIKEVFVHEAVLDFVRSEARKVEFMHTHNNESFPDFFGERRVLVHYAEHRHVDLSKATHGSSTLRSMFCLFFEKHPRPKFEPIDLGFLKRVEFLRVLEIISPNLSYLPDEIGELTNLRYIELRSISLMELPSTIANLLYLETLDIGGTSVRNVTGNFWRRATYLRNIIGLVSVPESLGVLHHVHRIDAFDFRKWNENWEMFVAMDQLRSLNLCGIKQDHGDSILSLLEVFNNLREVKLEGEFLPLKLFEVKSFLKLQSLEVKGKLYGRCDNLVLPLLENVAISNTDLKLSLIWLLARLPKMSKMNFYGCVPSDEMDNQIEVPLPELKSLVKWVQWVN